MRRDFCYYLSGFSSNDGLSYLYFPRKTALFDKNHSDSSPFTSCGETFTRRSTLCEKDDKLQYKPILAVAYSFYDCSSI